MRRDQKFYICKRCDTVVGVIESDGEPLSCCGEPMSELHANSNDAAGEKHLPVVSVAGDKVTVSVGEVHHPMDQDHLIDWVYLETERGGQRKSLFAGEKPVVSFALTDDDRAVSVFSYCNKHGLWRKDLLR